MAVGEYILYNDSNLAEYVELYSTNGYAVQSTNFASMPERIITTEKCPGDSDPFEFDAGWDARIINMTIIVLADSRTEMTTKLHTLKKILLNSKVRIYHVPTSKYVKVSPSKINIPETKDYRTRLVTISLDFVATVPWQLDNNIMTGTYSNIASSPYTIVHNNSGDIAVYPSLTVVNSSCSDIVSFKVTQIADGNEFSYTGTIAANSTLYIDNAQKIVETDNVNTIQYTEGNEWIKFYPGSNSITLEAVASSGFNYDFMFSYVPRFV